MARVSLDSLTVRFGDVLAVDSVSLEIDDGAFVVFLGPSGCGKTTTLRCIAGLEAATSGLILFDQEPVGHLAARARNVAMVFQLVSLYPHLTVRENIAFPLRARRERRAEIARKVKRIADTFDLADVLERRPGTLPPGTWQKAALARAVVREPRVLLLDEPLAAIDEQFREEMRWELRHIQRELGTTTIHVTHDQREAMSLADQVVLMRDGRIVQAGPPGALYDDPNDLFAAHFIGSPSINLVEGAIGGDGLTVGGQPLGAPAEVLSRLAKATTAGEIIVGIRPQNVTLTTERAGSVIEADVVDVASSGRDRHVEFRLAEAVCRGVAPSAGEIGARARFRLDPDRLLFFSRDGQRIRLGA